MGKRYTAKDEKIDFLTYQLMVAERKVIRYQKKSVQANNRADLYTSRYHEALSRINQIRDFVFHG